VIERRVGDKVWYCPDDLASEIELYDFLYGFIRLLKPSVVVETGCHRGFSSEAIGKALKVNGFGTLDTCDIEQIFVDATYQRTKGLPVNVHLTSAMSMLENIKNVEFAFIDSGTGRVQEAKALNLAPHAYVLLHDAHQQDYPGFNAIKAFGWTAMKLPTPVGLGIFEVLAAK
jgi:predicted O-methyltransferase YrrM